MIEISIKYFTKDDDDLIPQLHNDAMKASEGYCQARIRDEKNGYDKAIEFYSETPLSKEDVLELVLGYVKVNKESIPNIEKYPLDYPIRPNTKKEMEDFFKGEEPIIPKKPKVCNAKKIKKSLRLK